MSKDFKIGDRVISTTSGKDKRGVVVKHRDVDIKIYYGVIGFFRVVLDNGKSALHHKKFLRLDVQYYREERLKQLLENDNNEDGL